LPDDTIARVAAGRVGIGYEVLPSVWYGDDAGLLERMLDFYPRRPPERILDATVNRGRFWVGSARPVTGLDIDPRFDPDVVGDNARMPFADRSFDVVVYDPPHVPNQGRDNAKDFTARFGLGRKSSAETGYNFTQMFGPFLQEAYRVLRAEGVLFCKVADYVHNHRYQWAHLELVKAAVVAGLCACDCIVKVRKGPIIDPRWKHARHSRRHHCYWLLFRKSKRCE
jgi:SAM-dependent methyltransferase